MPKKSDIKILKFVLLLFLIIISFYITDRVAEQFPPIEIESTSHRFDSNAKGYINGSNFEVVEFGQSNFHHYCSDQYNDSMGLIAIYNLDESTIRRGDVVNIKLNINSNNGKLFNQQIYAGVKEDRLKKISKLSESIGLRYYTKENITTYILLCFNQKNIFEPKNTTEGLSITFERPSFIDSNVGRFLLFLTVFVLIGSALEIIMKLLFSKKLLDF